MAIKYHIYRHASIYLVFSLLNLLIGFLSVTYVSKFLSPIELGNVGILLSVLYVAMALVSFSSTGLVNIKQATETTEQYLIFRQVYISLMLVAAIFALVVLCGAAGNLIYCEAIILCFFRLMSLVHTQELVFKEYSVRCGILQLATNLAALLFTVFLISVMDLSYQGRILAWIFAEVLFVLIRFSFFGTYKLKTFMPVYNDIRLEGVSILRFGFPLILGSGAGWLLYHSDKFILLHFFSLEIVGVFTVAFSYGGVILLFGGSVLNAFKKHIYDGLKEKNSRTVFRYQHEVALIVLAGSILFVGFMALFHRFILNAQYLEHFHTIQILIAAYCVQAIAVVYGTTLEFYKKSSLRTYLYYLVALFYLVLSLIMHKLVGWDEDAFALGFFFAHLILLGLNFSYGKKVMNEVCDN